MPYRLSGTAGFVLAAALLSPIPISFAQAAPVAPAVDPAPLPPEQAAMKAHVMFLAADALRGREAGSAEYDIAAQYVASQFLAAGLRPAGDDGGYLQRVPLLSYRLADRGTFTLLRPGAQPSTLAFAEDYVPFPNAAAEVTLRDAQVVFVGYGIDAPGEGRDDYAGVDVRGKIVAFLGGSPEGLPSDQRAHFLTGVAQAATAQAKGAVGAIMLPGPHAPSLRIANYDSPAMTWEDGKGLGHSASPKSPLLAALTPAGAAKLFQGAGRSWRDIQAAAGTKDAKVRGMALPGTLAVSLRTRFEPLASSNVAGLLPGSDPDLRDEVVVLSAHLDHLGIGAPDATGDTLYNGAMDNAVGIAALIEEAKRFQASGKPPRRSILFLAVTAEEKGLVGSGYFANRPTVPRKAIVANVNLDMPILTYDFQDVVAFGADRSSLGQVVRTTAAAQGLGFAPDPMPQRSLFVRSDHYRFVQQGVPSVFLWPGFAGEGKAATERFFAERYHKPSDALEQAPPIDWAAGVKFIRVNYAIARAIADGDERPRWNKGDFFGLLYHGYGAR